MESGYYAHLIWGGATELNQAIGQIQNPSRRFLARLMQFLLLVTLSPLLVMLAIFQFSFEIMLRILDFVIPGSLTTIAFSAGAGGLRSGIGLTLTWLFLLPRYALNLILRFKLFFNIAFLVGITFIYISSIFEDVVIFSGNPSKTIRDYMHSWTPQDLRGFKDFIVLVVILNFLWALWTAFYKWLNRMNGFADE